MARSTHYVGLEVGTSKVCVVVGEVRNDGAIKILGVGQHPSAGVRKGEIVDFESVQTCLHEALNKAEDRSAVMVKQVYLAVTGAHIESLNNRGCIRIADDQEEISADDLEEVKEIAREVNLPDTNAFVHSIVRHYYVDGQEKVLNPVGMLGQKLEADYHIIHGVKNRIQNAIRCVREIPPIEVEDIVFSPIAAAQVVLNREAKQQGAILLDIGGGTTDYLMYVDGAIAASGSLGLGGDHVTNDLSIVLKIPLARAEKLKVEYGNLTDEDTANEGIIDLQADSHFAGAKVETKLINDVIRARMTETFQLVQERLQQTGGVERAGKGIYLTGGTALLKGVGEVAEDVFGLPVQKSNPASMSGPVAIFENPQYATPVGLIRYAQLLEEQRPRKGAIRSLGARVATLFGAVRSFG